MPKKRCPKCGHSAKSEVICPSCDFVLDTSFLGEGITDDHKNIEKDASTEIYDDCIIIEDNDIILGSFDEEEISFHRISPSKDVVKKEKSPSIYISQEIKVLLRQDAILVVCPDADVTRMNLTPYEKHVLQFINGKRHVARIRKKSGVSESDLELTLSTLIDKGLVKKNGYLSSSKKKKAEALHKKKVEALKDANNRRKKKRYKKRPVQSAKKEKTHIQVMPIDTEIVASLAMSELQTEAIDDRETGIAVKTNRASLSLDVDVSEFEDMKEEVFQEDVQETVEISFANRRKADSIFTQALKDYDAGNLGSAKMNVKLALIYNPNAKQFQKTLDLWERGRALQKALGPEYDLFDQAKKLEEQGSYKAAVKLLEKAIKLKPTEAAFYNRLGVLQATRLCMYQRASGNLLRASELEPKNLTFKSNLGKILAMTVKAKDKKNKKWYQ